MASLAPGLLPDPLPPYKDKTAYAVQRIDKDMQRKREQEFGWEDITDSAFLPLPQPLQSRFWRAPERLYRYSEGRTPAEIITFDQYNPPFIQIVGQRYRKRIGRGGRIHLDRLASRRIEPNSSGDEDGEGEDKMVRMRERWRYDADIPQELPSSRYPMVLDDFDTKFAATRSRMLAVSDWESVYPASSHLEEALRWTMREPDRPPPMQVIGKLPGQRIHAFANQPQGNAGGANGAQQQPQVGGSQMAGPGQAQAQALAAAALAANGNNNRTGGVQASQGPVGQVNGVTGGGGGGQQARWPSHGAMASPQPVNTPSAPSPGLPQPPQIRRLLWENGA